MNSLAKKQAGILLVLLLGAGFIVRLLGIHYGLPSKTGALTTYHPDEAISFNAIEKWKPSRLYFHPGRVILWGGFHLFPMAASLKIAQTAGYVQFGNREFFVQNLFQADRLYITARFVQVLCGTISIAAIFWVGTSAFGMLAGILSAFFLCFCAVHISNSFINRPDAMMIFLALLSLGFSVRIWETPKKLDSSLAGIFLGLAAATKYSAAPYGIFPLFFHLFSPARENRKNIFLFFGCGLISFLLGCPYLLLDFPWFRAQFLMNVSLIQNAITPVLSGPGWKLYATYFLPYGLGWPLAAAGLFAWFWMLFKALRERNRFLILWALGSLIVYAVISFPKSQMVHYTLPVVPLVLILAAYFFSDILAAPQRGLRIGAWVLALFVGAYSMIYSSAYLNLFVRKNVREKASEWIEQNIPKGETIAIARSYFWTPGILRQYHPPYRVVVGGDDQSSLGDAVLGLEKAVEKAPYLVLTEFEYGPYLNPQLGNASSKQSEVLKLLMQEKYREVKRFNQEPEFLGIRFPKKDTTPMDWIMPNPTILVFEKR